MKYIDYTFITFLFILSITLNSKQINLIMENQNTMYFKMLDIRDRNACLDNAKDKYLLPKAYNKELTEYCTKNIMK